VNLYFVKQSRLYVLLSGIRATSHDDSFVTCGGFGLAKSAFDTVRNKDKRRTSLCHLFWNIVRNDKQNFSHVIFSPLFLLADSQGIYLENL